MVWPTSKVVSWWELPLDQKIVQPFEAPLWKRMLIAIPLQFTALVWTLASYLGLNMTKHIFATPPVQRLMFAFLVAAVMQNVLLWLIWRWALGRGARLPKRRLVGRIIGGVVASAAAVVVTALVGTVGAVDAFANFPLALLNLKELALAWLPFFGEWRPDVGSITASATGAKLPFGALIESSRLVFVINVVLAIQLRAKRAKRSDP